MENKVKSFTSFQEFLQTEKSALELKQAVAQGSVVIEGAASNQEVSTAKKFKH